MKYTVDELLEEARNRDYTVTISTPDKSYYSLQHAYLPINLELHTKDNEFTLNYLDGLLKVTTGKCGSFMNHDHFMKFQRMVQMAIVKLNN